VTEGKLVVSSAYHPRAASVTQCKYHQNVASDRSFQLGVQLGQMALSRGTSTNRNGHILLPIDGIAYGIACNRRAERDFPKHLAGLSVPCPEVPMEISSKHQCARRCQYRADGRALIIGPQELACGTRNRSQPPHFTG